MITAAVSPALAAHTTLFYPFVRDCGCRFRRCAIMAVARRSASACTRSKDPGRDFPARRCRWAEYRGAVFRKDVLRPAAHDCGAGAGKAQRRYRSGWTICIPSISTATQTFMGQRTACDRSCRRFAGSVAFPLRCTGLHGVGHAGKNVERWVAESRPAPECCLARRRFARLRWVRSCLAHCGETRPQSPLTISTSFRFATRALPAFSKACMPSTPDAV